MQVIKFFTFGKPDVLKVEDVPMPDHIGARQCIISVTYAGVNMLDTVHRRGLYPIELGPSGSKIGVECVGIVEVVEKNAPW